MFAHEPNTHVKSTHEGVSADPSRLNRTKFRGGDTGAIAFLSTLHLCTIDQQRPPIHAKLVESLALCTSTCQQD